MQISFLKKVLFIVISLNCSCSFHFKDLFWFWMNGLYFWKRVFKTLRWTCISHLIIETWKLYFLINSSYNISMLGNIFIHFPFYDAIKLNDEWIHLVFKEALAKIRLIKRNGTWESDKHLKACQKISTWMLTLVKSNDKKIIVTFSYKISLLLFNTARYATKDFMKY